MPVSHDDSDGKTESAGTETIATGMAGDQEDLKDQLTRLNSNDDAGSCLGMGLAGILICLVLFWLSNDFCRFLVFALSLTYATLFLAPIYLLCVSHPAHTVQKCIWLGALRGLLLITAFYIGGYFFGDRLLARYHAYSADDGFSCPVRLYRHQESCSSYFDSHYHSKGLFYALWKQDARFNLCREVALDQRKEAIKSYEEAKENYPTLSCLWDLGICVNKPGCLDIYNSDRCCHEGTK